MPTYEFNCENDHHFERVLPVAEYNTKQTCMICGAEGRRILSLPQLHIQPDCRYTSPVDDRPITNWKQRREDLARHGCQPYDPEMKKDTDRFVRESNERLEKAVDATVEEVIEKMPSRKREALSNELLGGAEATPTRGTAPLAPVTRIAHGPK